MSIDQFLRHVFFNLVCKHISPIKQDTCILMNILKPKLEYVVRHMIQFPYPLLPTDLFMLHSRVLVQSLKKPAGLKMLCFTHVFILAREIQLWKSL